MLELFPDAEVLEANSLEGALATVRRNPISLVLFDLHLDSDDGLTGVRRMIEALEGFPDRDFSIGRKRRCDRQRPGGCQGYILKSGSSALLEHAISLVLSGETYVPLPRTVLVSAVAAEPEQPTNHGWTG